MKIEVLTEFGLTNKEAVIYIELLKEKSCTASKLAKLSGIQRTTTYLQLENLLEKGLVSYLIKDSKRYYQAASPDRLLEILESKKEKIKTILPELKNLHSAIEPFKFKIYEGKEGIKAFYSNVIKNASEMRVIGASGMIQKVFKYEYQHWLNDYLDIKLKQKILANYNAKKFYESYPRNVKIKYLPKEFSAEVVTIIYIDKVAIQSLIKKNIYVVVISDKKLYLTYRNLFEFMWNNL